MVLHELILLTGVARAFELRQKDFDPVTDQFAGGVTEHFISMAVGKCDSALGVDADDTLRGGFEQRQDHLRVTEDAKCFFVRQLRLGSCGICSFWVRLSISARVVDIVIGTHSVFSDQRISWDQRSYFPSFYAHPTDLAWILRAFL